MNLQDLLKSSSVIKSQQREYARCYVRVSHERSAEKNISPETQRQRIECYCRERGYEVIEWYSDLGISAFRSDSLRTEWQRMIADSKTDPLTTVIVVWRYDRFSRGDNAQSIQHELLRHGVRIESAEEGYYDPDSESGAIMMPLQWGLSRMFSIKLRNVVIPNMKTNFQQRDGETGWAYKNGGWAQWGYKKHRIKIGRNAKSMDVHKAIWLLDDTVVAGKPVHEWARTMLLEWRLQGRLGYDSIAAKLTEAGVPTPSGKAAWSTSTVQSLIGDWSRLWQYTGVAFWNREDCTDRGNRKQRDTSEWTVVEKAHPAIITSEEAEAIWSMVEDKKRPKSGRNGEESRFALSGGFLVCAQCGANYAGVKRKAGDYYVCGSHIYRKGANCDGPSWYIPREEVETLLLSKIAKRLTMNDEELAGWVAEINASAQEQWKPYLETRAERRKKIKELERQLSSYYDVVARVGCTDDLAGRIADTQAAMERLVRLDSAEQPCEVTLDMAKSLRDTVLDAQHTPAARRIVIKWFDPKIVVDAKNKALDGVLTDPRAVVYISMAVPRGDVANVYPRVRIASTMCKRGFWGQGTAA